MTSGPLQWILGSVQNNKTVTVCERINSLPSMFNTTNSLYCEAEIGYNIRYIVGLFD